MNRIFPEQLASNLNSHLAKVYFLVGTDPLLLSESEDLIHQAALLQGFDEKNQITIDTNTDWSALIEASQSMGLFFNKQNFHSQFTRKFDRTFAEKPSAIYQWIK